MSDDRCPVCGETRMEGWDQCPACGSPYPDSDIAKPPERNAAADPLPTRIGGTRTQ